MRVYLAPSTYPQHHRQLAPMAKKAKTDPELQSPRNDDTGDLEPSSRYARPVGIKDIAKALEISIGTVDRAIHDRGRINLITKERVLKMAQTLGYKPNLAARYLKAPRQVRVSVNLPAKIGPFFDAVRAGILDAASPF